MGEHLQAGPVRVGDRALTPDGDRVVRVVPDVSGIEAEFDYLVPGGTPVSMGSIVRADLHGRRVRAWVVDVDVTPPEGVRLRQISKVSGAGPTPELIELASWAAERWLGKRSFFLQAASPTRVARSVPAASVPTASTDNDARHQESVLRLPPATDPIVVVREAHAGGPVLVITPSRRAAERLARMCGSGMVLHPESWERASQEDVSVVGTRTAVWAPMQHITKIIIIDAHDQAHQSEASPTWSAIDVASERARRRRIPLQLISSVPRTVHLHGRELQTVERSVERNGWAQLHVIDMLSSDPHKGLYSSPLVELLRSDKRVVCVLNRKGRAQLLSCASCKELARCNRCEGPLQSDGRSDGEQLECRRCGHVRPLVCRHCMSAKFKTLRAGVSKVLDDLASLTHRSVGEVTGDTEALPETDVLVGTEAVLHRVGRADAVVFLEFDQELLATRFSAAEDALVLLARAARLVGSRSRNGSVHVQTRLVDHEVIEAALHADPDRVTRLELERRKEMNLPPSTAVARVSGAGASALVETLGPEVEVLGPNEQGEWVVVAPDHDTLSALLAGPRRASKERTRVEVDPLRF